MNYYLNLNTGEVHTATCIYCNKTNFKLLGTFSNSTEAVNYARRITIKADGCAHCCPSSHTK